MSGKLENCPFPRGGYMEVSASTDQAHWEGKEYLFENLDYSTSPAKARAAGGAGSYVRCRCVRNVAAAALLPKRLVTFKTTAYGLQVDGYATTTAAEAYPVDEFLPAAGVPVNYLFWIVVDGPATVLSDLAGADNNVIGAAGVLVALTAATSGATTAGRVAPQDLTGATALLAAQVQNRLGNAVSAKTTANTNADVLMHVKRW
jgi:hypothetical protein